MICCDCCQEWYHGECVGIAVSQREDIMSRDNEKYVCPLLLVVTITRNGTERNVWFREIPILRNALKTR